MGKVGTRLTLAALAALASVLVPATAWSTEGYFQLGFSPVQNALGGAGVANSEDAMSMALNPAGIVGLDEQFQIGASLFMPYRGYTGTGTPFIAPGTHDSSSNIFLMPNMAYSRPIDDQSAIGIVVYGNGGMNTNYKNVVNTGFVCTGASGVYCAGDTGVDLMQAFVSVDYARRFGNVSIGIAPTFAIQRFSAKGLGFFTKGSAYPNDMTDNGYDWSYGGGLRGGLQVDITKQLRLGVSGQTKMWMTKFDKYRGLFAGQGSFDIPAAVTAGIAYDVTPRLTVMADYQRIFYSGVDAVGDSSTVSKPFGSDGGPGFGWHDVNVYKFGVEYRANDFWTLRAGYAYSDNPVQSADVALNILAPGVVQHHITAGATYKVSKKSAVDFAFVYVPETKISGPDGNGGTVELNMHQFLAQVGWSYHF